MKLVSSRVSCNAGILSYNRGFLHFLKKIRCVACSDWANYHCFVATCVRHPRAFNRPCVFVSTTSSHHRVLDWHCTWCIWASSVWRTSRRRSNTVFSLDCKNLGQRARGVESDIGGKFTPWRRTWNVLHHCKKYSTSTKSIVETRSSAPRCWWARSQSWLWKYGGSGNTCLYCTRYVCACV